MAQRFGFRSSEELLADPTTRRQALRRLWSGVVGLGALSLFLPETAEAKKKKKAPKKQKKKSRDEEKPEEVKPTPKKPPKRGRDVVAQQEDEETKRNPIPWHDLAQEDRNLLIVGRGMDDVGRTVDVECKPWVQRVVEQASGGVVKVPSTTEGGIGCAWQQSRDVGEYRQSRVPRPGEIIQMQLQSRDYWDLTGGHWFPHTAIVVGVSQTGMTWLDSNYVKTKNGREVGNNFVDTHEVTFDYFNKKVICYNIYYIL